MTVNRRDKQHDVFDGSGADIMNNKRHAERILFIGNNPDMGNPSAQSPSDDIPRQIIFPVFGDREGCVLAFEKRLKIRNAAVIDIFIGSAQTLNFRIA